MSEIIDCSSLHPEYLKTKKKLGMVIRVQWEKTRIVEMLKEDEGESHYLLLVLRISHFEA